MKAKRFGAVGLLAPLASLAATKMTSSPLLSAEGFSPTSRSPLATKARHTHTPRTIRGASLRDLADDGDRSDKKKKSDEGNFFSKIHDTSKMSAKGFPERVGEPEDDERGQRVDRLGTFSFASGGEGGGRKKRADRAPEVAEDAPERKEGRERPVRVRASDAGDANADCQLAPDDFNNRGVFISKTKFPSRDKRIDSAHEIDHDDHSQALKTFSFASSSRPKRMGRAAPAPSSSTGSGSDKTVSDRMDRLTTFSLSSAPLPPLAAATAAADASASADNPDEVNHVDRLSTFSFASSPPKSGTSNAKLSETADYLRGSSSADPPTGSQRPSPLEKTKRSPSLSSLASALATATRALRIKEMQAKNDPRTLHPDGMNVPRLNSGGSVLSMSGRGGKRNIFQRIEERVSDDDPVEGAGGDGSDADEGASADSFDDGADWGDSSDLTTKRSRDEDDDRDSNDIPKGSGDCFVGFDLGTSGARISVVEKRLGRQRASENQWDYAEVFAAALTWDDILHCDDAYDWRSAVDALLMRAKEDVGDIMERVRAMCVSGTSATCLLLEKGTLDVSRVARMYNFDVLRNSEEEAGEKKSSKAGKEVDSPAERVIKLIDKYVPERHTARATTGSLAKLLLWNEEEPLVDDAGVVKEMICHQSDYVALSLMHGGMEQDGECTVSSDWHNCLKLGYDVRSLSYPDWMLQLLKEGANIPSPEDVLPSKVMSPGEPMGAISPIVATKYGLQSDVVMVGGTTDSNAAFFAAAGARPEFGQAVTSLGSTVALKQLSKTFVEDASRGVYSHRFPRFGGGGNANESEEAWLIGGASNVGCAVLRQEEFSNEELATLSSEIDPDSDSPLSYYPLTKKGERFPIADSDKEPVLHPKPDSRKDYLHGILQAIGDVERDGYRILGNLGATPSRPTEILTCGGGSKNEMWTAMRERRLRDICNEEQRIVVKKALNTEASYGAALLAAASFE